MSDFRADPFPGRPRILFIGYAESSHTHSWINLLQDARLNVRLFGVSSALPPEDWRVRTYIPSYVSVPIDPEIRMPRPWSGCDVVSRAARFCARVRPQEKPGGPRFEERWLAEVIDEWRPDIVHTLGLDPAGFLHYRVRSMFGLSGVGRWVLQLRGGSDLALSRLDPKMVERIAPVVRACDQVVSDNLVNIRYVREMGVTDEQVAPITPVPGAGGVDVDAMKTLWQGPPSARRLILWPKVYESPWSKFLPVYEALKIAWDRIQPCEMRLLAMYAEARMWWWTLPEPIRRACRLDERIPHAELLPLMGQARVMLAPSLVDGIPNSMYEAMAAGAFPILSPLETITPIGENEKNLLFARNLYPQEIADALVRAMRDDCLVDKAATVNLMLVGRIADRAKIRPRVIEYYESLVAASS